MKKRREVKLKKVGSKGNFEKRALCIAMVSVILLSNTTALGKASMTSETLVSKLNDTYTDKTETVKDEKYTDTTVKGTEKGDDAVKNDNATENDVKSEIDGESTELPENSAKDDNDAKIESSSDEQNDKNDKNDDVTQILPRGMSDKVMLEFDMIPRMELIDSFASVELRSFDGTVLGEKTEWVGGITEKLLFEFDVPTYKLGESFYLILKDGLSYIRYYDSLYRTDERIKLDTYGYTDEDGKYVTGNSFAFDACPIYEHMIVVYAEGELLELSPRARLMDDTAMVPVRAVAEAIGLDVRYDDVYKSVVCEIDGKQALFNIGTDYATFMGEDTFMPAPCTLLDDTTFVPVRSLAEAFGCSVEAIDFEDHIDVCLGESPVVKEYTDKFAVNKMNISSKTRYMVWIDKSDYRVRVYKGRQGKWNEIKSFPCAIGAVDSPTITGSFEYEYRMSQWTYPEYYVGPCLVFYGNYAMHSTLIAYDGTPYDDRVGVKISHGCVRLHKSDIDWLDNNLPTGSRVYITE